jgi:hypothetical protein
MSVFGVESRPRTEVNLAALYVSRSSDLAQQIDLVAQMAVQLGDAWDTCSQRGKGRLLFEHVEQHAPALFSNGQST